MPKRKLQLVVDNGPRKPNNTTIEDLNYACLRFMLACWGL